MCVVVVLSLICQRKLFTIELVSKKHGKPGVLLKKPVPCNGSTIGKYFLFFKGYRHLPLSILAEDSEVVCLFRERGIDEWGKLHNNI